MSQIPGEKNTYYQGQRAIIPVPGNNYQGVSQTPRERTNYYQGQQAMPPSQIQPIYSHGQEAVPNNDPRSLQNFKNEILQAVREEVDSRMARNP